MNLEVDSDWYVFEATDNEEADLWHIRTASWADSCPWCGRFFKKSQEESRYLYHTWRRANSTEAIVASLEGPLRRVPGWRYD